MVRRRDRNVWLCYSKQIILLDGLFDCLSIWPSGTSLKKLHHLLQVRVKHSLSVNFVNIHCRKPSNGLQNRSQESVVLGQGEAFAWCKGTVCFLRDSPQWARGSFTRFLYHTQRRTKVGRTPLDGWSARRRDLSLRTHNTHNRQTDMPR